MILLIAFIMLCCFGLGVAWNVVWVNIKELDAWLDRRAKEEKQLVETFKKSVEIIKKELDNNISSSNELNKLKQNMKGMVK
jgi:predicted PurR-regulated permease PerM